MDVRNRPSRAFILGVLWALALVVAACNSATDPAGEERRLGLILGFNKDDPRVVVPDTVQTGAEHVVEVTTYGNSCFRKGEVEVASSGDVVMITPYDYMDVSAGHCEEILLSFVHQATVEFPEAGLASVVIVGRVGGSMEKEAVEITREVVIRAQGSARGAGGRVGRAPAEIDSVQSSLAGVADEGTEDEGEGP